MIFVSSVYNLYLSSESTYGMECPLSPTYSQLDVIVEGFHNSSRKPIKLGCGERSNGITTPPALIASTARRA